MFLLTKAKCPQWLDALQHKSRKKGFMKRKTRKPDFQIIGYAGHFIFQNEATLFTCFLQP